jgi:hypothetical protein
MPPAPQTRRRWYQFGLRTLFVVVAVVAAFLAYHVNWIRQRRVFLDSPEVLMATEEPFTYQSYIVVTLGRTKAPWPLSWVGEPGYVAIELRNTPSPEEAALFPEAFVFSLATNSSRRTR